MGLITIPIAETVDLNHGTKTVTLPYPLIRGDNEAHEIVLALKSGGNDVPIAGATVYCYGVISDKVSTAIASGTASGNIARATLNDAFYSKNGSIDMIMRLKLGSVNIVPLRIIATVQSGITDTIIDPTHVIRSLDELLSTIEDCIEATNGANTAASSANAAKDAVLANESTRQSNEVARVNAESGRVSAENTRQSQEATRQSNESTRQTEEMRRVGAESTRVSNESTRGTSESTRQSNEIGRVNAESGRVSAENTRQSQEATRQSNESSRQSAETARASAEAGRGLAETQRVQQENARQAEIAKLSGMTVSETSVEYGASPQAQLIEQDGVYHLDMQVERGPQGPGYTIKGQAYATVAALQAAVPSPTVGDQYNVGAAAPYNVYRWTGSAWEDQGTIQGQSGQDGVSPTANVVKTGRTTTITITDADGTTTATVTDGLDGVDGADAPPTVHVGPEEPTGGETTWIDPDAPEAGTTGADIPVGPEDARTLAAAIAQHDQTVTVMNVDAWNALDTTARAALYATGTRIVVATRPSGTYTMISLYVNGRSHLNTGADIPVSGTDATKIDVALAAKQDTITSDNAATVRTALRLKNGALLRVECGSVMIRVEANSTATETIVFDPPFAQTYNAQLTLTTSVDPKNFSVCISALSADGMTIKIESTFTAVRNIGVHWQASSEE